jgi:pilus assembly protein Flp/PilA
MKKLLTRFVRDEDGQDLIEYSLLAALISVVCIAILRTIGQDINDLFGEISAAIQGV